MDLSLKHDGVDVTFIDGACLEGGRPTAEAMADISSLVAKLPEFRAYAADKLLDLYNDTWLSDDIGHVTREQFVARLKVEGINVYAPGTAEVFFLDGDLFAGHGIEVTVKRGVPTGAGLAG